MVLLLGQALDLEAVDVALEVVSATSIRCAAIFRALSRILRADAGAAAPATGVEREP